MVGCLRRGVCDEQKWSKGKMREKVANKVLFDEDLHTRLEAEIPKVRGRGCFHMPCVMSAASAHMENGGGGGYAGGWPCGTWWGDGSAVRVQPHACHAHHQIPLSRTWH